MRNLRRLILGLFAVGFLAACTNSGLSFTDVQSSENANFFSYPYKSAPLYYLSSSLYSTDGATPLSVVTYKGAAALAADPTQAVDYTVTISSADGQTRLAPVCSGTLNGSSQISCSFTLSAPSAHVLVTLTATSGTSPTAQIQTAF